MDAITLEAIDQLGISLNSLLPPVADPALAPDVTVLPLSVSPTGVGGFVEVQANPVGEVYGRKLDARVDVLVKSDGAGINAAVTGVTNALLAADRATLLTKGILRLTLDTLGPVSAEPGSPVTQQVQFRVLFEFLKRPMAADGIILTVPVNIQLQQS